MDFWSDFMYFAKNQGESGTGKFRISCINDMANKIYFEQAVWKSATARSCIELTWWSYSTQFGSVSYVT